MFEIGLWPFIALTCVIGGCMALATGRSVASSWNSLRHLVAYTVLLALVDRFLHFALFDGTLLSVRFLVIDFAILLAAALAGFYLKRREQMRRQYGFRATADRA